MIYETFHAEKIIFSPKKYMIQVENDFITDTIRAEMHSEYLTIQNERSLALTSKIKQLYNILESI